MNCDEYLPPAYGGCKCQCHRDPKVKHFAACCHPQEPPLQPADNVIQSLLAYREELLEVAHQLGRMPETLFKINSCLYGKYPPPEQGRTYF